MSSRYLCCGFEEHRDPSDNWTTSSPCTHNSNTYIVIIVVYTRTQMVTRHNIIIILFSYALSTSAATYVYFPSFSTRGHIIILPKHLTAACTQTYRDFTPTGVMFLTVFEPFTVYAVNRFSLVGLDWTYCGFMRDNVRTHGNREVCTITLFYYTCRYS